MMFFPRFVLFFALGVVRFADAFSPFFQQVDDAQWVIGNDVWNITIGSTYGKKLFYKERDLIGDAVGHYASTTSNFVWKSARVYSQTSEQLDIVFEATEVDFHWVISEGEAGAYQYFVNNALPALGILRSLFRLDNQTFVNGKNAERDAPLPPLSDILSGTNVQDETWLLADGTYITKYDFSSFVRLQDFYGVYGPEFGSWYIHAGKEDWNGDHLKQELLIHRESSNGDAVQLNVIHGTHFMSATADTFEVGKVWGPWFWYLNDGNLEDVATRASEENSKFPYKWFNSTSYNSRGSISGTLVLSDGRPASGAAVFLGDNNSPKSTLDQGERKYYTNYTSSDGSFQFSDVQTNTYALSAWSNGGSIGDVSTTFLQNDIVVEEAKDSILGGLTWETQNRSLIWQIGEIDRKATGFKNSDIPRAHGLAALSPANLTFIPGVSRVDEWYYAQSSIGSWTVPFNLTSHSSSTNSTLPPAILKLSLAGYSQGFSNVILVNGIQVGNITSGSITTDPSVYRSGNVAGEWHLLSFSIEAGLLKDGGNEVVFKATRSTIWHGVLWDSILLEWA